MSVELLDALEPGQLPRLLPSYLAERVEGLREEQVRALVEGWDEEDFRSLLAHLRELGTEHRVYDAHPRIRVLARAYLRFVFPEWSLSGHDHLRRALQDGPTVIVGNHLSYIDAMATDAALAWAGSEDLADRIVYVAGPKVYARLFRLLAAASIHNLPVPQSTRLGHTEPLPPRELARRVRRSIDASERALRLGRAVLLYPEGARTRSGRFGPFIGATRRYLEAAVHLVPAAIAGTERAMPIGGERLVPARLALRFGPVLKLDGIPGREALAQAHAAIDRLLPEELRAPEGEPRLR